MPPYASLQLNFLRTSTQGESIRLAQGTGFLWSLDKQLFLITCWHNVTGVDPLSGTALSPHASQPTHVEMQLLFQTDANRQQKVARRERHVVPLYIDEDSPAWLEHPTGCKVDVVALALRIASAGMITNPINQIDDFVDFVPSIGDDVFVLGFPKGMDGGPALAIWKRGSIASQPTADLGGLPKLLIDTATRQGMSGAPVIVRQRGLVRPRTAINAPLGLSDEDILGEADSFLGVYSGRIGDDEFGVQLGIVWKAAVIAEIVAGGNRGRVPWGETQQG